MAMRDRLDAAEARATAERQTTGRLHAELHAAQAAHTRTLSDKVRERVRALKQFFVVSSSSASAGFG